MEEIRNPYMMMVRKPQGKSHVGTPRHSKTMILKYSPEKQGVKV
jgi:hypothetical protein